MPRISTIRRTGHEGKRQANRSLPPGWVRVEANDRTVIHTSIELVSNANKRGHWSAAASRAKAQKQAVFSAFLKERVPVLPVEVEIIRVMDKKQREFDDDNLTAGGKSIRDAIAMLYGVDDRRKDLIRFEVRQVKGGYVGTSIVISPVLGWSGITISVDRRSFPHSLCVDPVSITNGAVR